MYHAGRGCRLPPAFDADQKQSLIVSGPGNRAEGIVFDDIPGIVLFFGDYVDIADLWLEVLNS